MATSQKTTVVHQNFSTFSSVNKPSMCYYDDARHQ
uniref:Uncharacterized protein n=1 Tax=Nelumbo nucifera TaxID=4432 RepID=A0A822Y2F5_NELNU|nr:TPA_asm: hypothetical protein HUJ06_027611 [Nelumbo nucifera]